MNQSIITYINYSTARLLEQLGFLSMIKCIGTIMRDESGTTAFEYGLIAVMVTAVAVPAVSATGLTLEQIFNAVSAVLSIAAG